MSTAQIDFEGRLYSVLGQSATGVVRSTVEGRAVIVSGMVRDSVSAVTIIARSKSGVIYSALLRSDGADFSSFDLRLPLEIYDCEPASYALMDFYALGAAGAQSIVFDKSQYYLDYGNLTLHHFYTFVQNPATRIKDQATLLYLGEWFLRRNQGDFIVASAALCVVGYRHLERKDNESLIRILSESGWLYEATVDLSQRFNYRWFVSIRLLAAYANVIAGDFSAAIERLREIVDSADGLDHTPQMATNTLKATLLGGLLLEHMERGSGSTFWQKARPILTRAVACWEYENYYSYSELSQSVLLSRECMAALTIMARLAGDASANSANIAPLDMRVNIGLLGFPATAFNFGGLIKVPFQFG